MKKIKEMNIKQKEILFSVTVILIVIIVAVIILLTRTHNKLELKKETVTVEYGNTISTDAKEYLSKDVDKDIIKNTKVTSKVENEKDKEYPAIGSYKVTLTYKDEKAIVKIKVKDTIKPVIKGVESIDMVQETDLATYDFNSLFTITDLSQVETKFDTSKIDVNTVGNYTLKVVAIDKYKNKAELKVPIKVTEKLVKQNTDVSTASGSTMTRSSGNGTTGSNYSSNAGTGESTTSQAPAQHVHVYSTFGNYFHTDAEVDAWANNYIFSNQNMNDVNGTKYTGYGVNYCSCGLIGIHFLK